MQIKNRIRPFDLVFIGIFLQCVVFVFTQIMDVRGRTLYLATDTLFFLILLLNDRVRSKAIGLFYSAKRRIKKFCMLNSFGQKLHSYEKIKITPSNLWHTLFVFIFLILVNKYWTRASGCTANDLVCLVRFFGGGWDVQYSWLLRGYISSYISSPSEVLRALTWVSADYPILVPSILASLVSIHISLMKLIPITSALICLWLVYYSCEFKRGHPFISLLFASTFLFYKLFNGLLYSLYPDLLISGLLLYVFINVERGRFDANILVCMLIFPLIKREGLFYLVGLLFVLIFVYQVRASSLLRLLWKRRILTVSIIFLYGLQLSLGQFYGGNKLTNAMTLSLEHVFENLIVFFSMLVDKPWRYFYLMPVFAILTPSGFTKVVNLLFAFMFFAYLVVLAMLPISMNVTDFINVTFDRLVLQFYPLYVYSSARYWMAQWQNRALSNLQIY